MNNKDLVPVYKLVHIEAEALAENGPELNKLLACLTSGDRGAIASIADANLLMPIALQADALLDCCAFRLLNDEECSKETIYNAIQGARGLVRVITLASECIENVDVL